MKVIKTKDAVGHVICHDMTRIIKDKEKGVAFKKGHVVREEDIEALLKMGKDTLYVWEKKEGYLHEDEAAEILLSLCQSNNLKETDISEGKVSLKSEVNGYFEVDTQRLEAINGLSELMISTRRTKSLITKDEIVAGMRAIPLIIDENKLFKAKEIAGSEPLMKITPFKKVKVGLITTGNEVFHGRIEDTFTPVIKSKFEELTEVTFEHVILPDNHVTITEEIIKMQDKNVDLVVCTGGMSVDPDDKTPLAIKNTGAEIISYGAPVLPGAMFLVSYLNNMPVLGLPGCVMYAKRTVFDLFLPQILADIKMTHKDIAELGNGGLCLNCEVCHYPNCSFGR